MNLDHCFNFHTEAEPFQFRKYVPNVGSETVWAQLRIIRIPYTSYSYTSHIPEGKGKPRAKTRPPYEPGEWCKDPKTK